MRLTPAGASRVLLKPVRLPSALTFCGATVAVLALLPAVYLMFMVVQLGVTDAFVTVSNRYIRAPFVTTVGLAGAVAASSALVGLALAWLVTRTDLPGRRMWHVLTCLPAALPSYLLAFAYLSLGPVDSFAGAWLVLTLLGYPYVLLPVAATLGGIDPSLEETARSLGDGRSRVLARVILPLVRPAVATGAVLVALFVVSDLGAVALLDVHTLTVFIYDTYQGGGDPARSAVLGCMLMLFTVILVLGEGRSRGRARQYRLGTGSPRPQVPVNLGWWRWPALLVPLTASALALGVPGVVVGKFGLTAGKDSLDTAALWRAASASLGLAAAAAVVTVIAALPVALLAARRSDRISRVVERSAYLSHCLPGLLMALAVAYFAQRVVPSGYPRLPALVFTYLVLFLPLALSPLYARARQLPPVLDGVARSLGRHPLHVVSTVTGPLLAPGFATSAALVFLACLKELPAVLAITPLGFETLAIQAFSAAEDRAMGPVAVASALLVAIGAAVSGPLLRRTEELR